MSKLISYFSLWSLRKRIVNRRISLLSYFDKESFISNYSSIKRFVSIRNSTVDDFSYIGPNSLVINAKIGRFCSISKNVNIGLPMHPIDHGSTSPMFFSNKNGIGIKWRSDKVYNDFPKPVEIGNDVWIGLNVSIVGGIKIGHGAIIGSHALVTKDVAPYAIVGGVPARVIRFRFSKEIIEELERIQWWNLSIETLKKSLHVFDRRLNITEMRKQLNS